MMEERRGKAINCYAPGIYGDDVPDNSTNALHSIGDQHPVGGKEMVLMISNDRKTESWAPALQKHNVCVTSTQQRWVGTECILCGEVGSNHLRLLWSHLANQRR